MSNYTKTTDFEAKDSLPTGDSGKIIRGSEFETEFDAISTAIATKADTAGPTFTGTLTFETISDGTIGVTAFVDEDDMSSDSATLVPTQQSVKAYVDSQVTAQDLDFQADSGGALSIDLDSESLTFTGGTGIDTSGALNAVTFAIDSTVTTLTGTQTLTNKTLTSPDVNTPDIDGGTIDGATIATSDITVGTGKTLDVSGGTLTLADNQISGDKVEGGTIASTTITDLASTTVDTTNLEVTNIKAKDGTSAGSIADTTGVVTLASSVLTTTDINGGTIDGATIGGTTAAAGSFTTVSATGNITVDGTVDGRDVATDGTKLDGIEASADVTDATNVTAAGALMDSELTSEASVKALNQGVATTDSPTFAGLTTTADVSFGDNDKAVFGAGSDLQIFHDGSNSYIDDAGTGGLIVRADNFYLRKANDVENMIIGSADGAVTLYHDNSAKLATTSTGIDVTGTAKVSTSMMVGSTDAPARDLEIKTSNPHIRLTDTDGGYTEIFGGSGITTINADKGQNVAGSVLKLSVDATDGLTIDSSHNVSLPNGNLDVTGTVTADGLTVDGSDSNIKYDVASSDPHANPTFELKNQNATDGNVAVLKLSADNANGVASSAYVYAQSETANQKGNLVFAREDGANTPVTSMKLSSNGDISFYEDTGTTAKLFWDASAESLGIGTSSPAQPLHVDATGGTTAALLDNNGTNGDVVRVAKNGTDILKIRAEGTADLALDASGGAFIFKEGGTEAMRIDSSGQVGIGCTPSRNLDIQGTGDTLVSIVSPAANQAALFFGDTDSDSVGRVAYDNSDNSMRLNTNGSEAMRIDSSGNLGIGVTSVDAKLKVQAATGDTTFKCFNAGTGSQTYIGFNISGGATNTGSITTNGTTTAYNTSSDQRLKDNIVDAPSASDDIDAIQVRSFDWKADGSHQKYGMVAQELQSVAPEAVTGDADLDDMMGVDYSKLVPMMLKEIQSLRARVAQLEGAN